jgi:DUF438 domain-containing protein
MDAGKKAVLKRLLQELKGGQASPETKAKAKAFFASVDAKTIGLLEQELIQEGISHEEVRASLCDIHLDVMKDSLMEQRQTVAAPHPVHTLMEEHRLIQGFLRRLEGLVQKLRESDSFARFAPHLEELRDIAHHLVEAESHHQREEDALFPVLEARGIVEPPRIMKLDHVELRKRKKDLLEIASEGEKAGFETFRTRVTELGDYLTRELDGHIFKEDNILYQMALQALTPEEWNGVKEECDRVGYCCFTPQDILKSRDIVELDLRPLHPFERHDKIFEVWETLKPGQSLRIINDHDPKPLHYQFQAEQKGKFEWHYEERGPKDWRVRIDRI